MLADVLLAALSSDIPQTIPLKNIYLAFYELESSGQFPALLAPLSFISVLDVPVSEALEVALFRLCSSGLATVDNPDYRFLRVDQEKQKVMAQILNQHYETSRPDDLKELRRLAGEFSRIIKSYP